jgi:DNA modification methylase
VSTVFDGNGPRLEVWAIDRVKPYEKNPRSIPDKAVAKVAGSLKTFGFQKPIVVDEHGVIIAGHVVLKAALQAGFSRVPVLISALDAKAAKAYRIADNRTAQETDWIEDLLKSELTALDDDGFDLGNIGFDDRELQKLMSDDEELARAEETPEAPVNPVSIEGDVWVLGNHRIICGDSTKAETVEKVLGSVKPHLMVTDPPYGVVYDANWRNEAERADGKPYGARAVGKVLNDDRADWTEARVLFPGQVAYVWHADRHASEVQGSLEAAGFDIRCQIVWAKNNIAIGRGDYHWQHEPCWYAVKQKAKGHWNGDRSQSTLWKIDKPQKSETGHSTQKPVECMRRPIINNSSPGQAIYEPFSGSGTTIIAAEMTGRHCYAIELNPAYVDVAVKRWEQFTGSKATLDGDGRTFEEIDAARYAKTGAPDNSAACYDAAIAAKRAEHEFNHVV